MKSEFPKSTIVHNFAAKILPERKELGTSCSVESPIDFFLFFWTLEVSEL
jgi:hypothetical protein